MKKIITIYSNIVNKNLFDQLFTNYQKVYKNLEDLKKNTYENEVGLIFLNDNFIKNQIKNKNFIKNFVIISSDNDLGENTLKPPVDISTLKKSIKKIFDKNKNKNTEIEIIHQKIINKNNNKSVHLTNIEEQILQSLIENNKVKRKYIKENILNIKGSLETNSLDSHLTRIRKKLISANVSLKIISKNDMIFLSN